MPDDDPTAGDSVSGGGAARSGTPYRSPQEWRYYFQTEEGRSQLESIRFLLGALGNQGLPIEEQFLTKGHDPIRMTATLTELVHLGELEVRTNIFGAGSEFPRTFVRRKLS